MKKNKRLLSACAMGVLFLGGLGGTFYFGAHHGVHYKMFIASYCMVGVGNVWLLAVIIDSFKQQRKQASNGDANKPQKNSKNDKRMNALLIALTTCFLGILTIQVLRMFHVVKPLYNEWSFLDRLEYILGTTLLGGSSVVAAASWEIKHYTAFSKFEKILTRWTVMSIAALIYIYGVDRILKRIYACDKPLLDIQTFACLVLGAFLVFWGLVFIGRHNRQVALQK